MDRIDFRSDTVTWPTAAMRAAMAAADVGDDVYEEDPTVNRLEALAAEMVGMPAGLFVASGTMGNLVSILAHANRGDEAIVGEANHTLNWEAGGMAVLGGVVPRVLPMDEFARMDLDAIERSVRPDNPHLPVSRLILLETTAGGRNGVPLPLDYMASVRALADRHGLVVHLDGARLFNAATALHVPAAQITQHVDSVTFCLSKGLCAPVGSLICGSEPFIQRARRMRKLVGGGMRQAGVLAAAGILSLTEMTQRLGEDHANARRLAAGLASIPDIVIDPQRVYSNMLFFGLTADVPIDADAVAERLSREYNIWIGVRDRRAFRAVTHYWVGADAVYALVNALRAVLSSADVAVESGRPAGHYG